MSGPNLRNNVDFLRGLTPENADDLFDRAEEYFQTMRTNIVTPNLFKEFSKRNGEAKAKLADQVAQCCHFLAAGRPLPESLFSDDIKQEILYLVIRSSSLSQTIFNETLDKCRGRAIPQPSFSQKIELELHIQKKEGEIKTQDMDFLRATIGQLENHLSSPPHSHPPRQMKDYVELHFQIVHKKNAPLR